MKKIILILLILILTGCFEESGYITKSCIKEEKANTLTTTTTYTFTFKNDIISDLTILDTYKDENSITISSLKTSIESQNKFLDLNYEVLSDNENEYQIKYNIDMNSNEEIKDKFMVKNSRTELVNLLKENGFICK